MSPRRGDGLHGDGFHGSQSGFLIEQLLDVGSSRALRLCDGAAFLQGPGGVVQPAAQGLQVGITGIPVRVGQEGEELGGAERPWGGAFRRLHSNTFTVTQATPVSLSPVRYTGTRICDAAVRGDRRRVHIISDRSGLMTPAGCEDWFPVHCEGGQRHRSQRWVND